jgi:tetratricopeptide (TPR) repeat protein
MKNLTKYINEPRSQIINFDLGKEYEDQKQYSAAISFYLRTAEYGEDKMLIYEALLRVALCFEMQGKRNYTMKGALLRAVSVMPSRPEAYFLMCRTYEICKEWHEAYAWSFIGERVKEKEPLKTDVQYPGPYGFIYERAVVSYWIGLYQESLNLFRSLQKVKMYPIHEQSVKSNIENVVNILRSKGKYIN